MTKYDLTKFNINKNDFEEYKKVRKYETRKVNSRFPNDIFAIDLIDMKNKEHKNFNYIIIAVDVFSRKIFYDIINYKNINAIKDGLDTIFEKSKHTPNNIWTDGEGAIHSKEMQNYLTTKYKINTYQTYGKVHNPIAERAIRTIKELSEKLSEKTGRSWYYLIGQIVDVYNETKHNSINDTPNNAYENNSFKALAENIKNNNEKINETHKYSVGDLVKVQRKKGIHEKGYTKTFNPTVRKITKVTNTNPTSYKIEGLKGAFYDNQIIKIIK